MSKQAELENLDRAIKDSQIRIHTTKNNIGLLDDEIEKLKTLEITLKENVKCLKQSNIIAIATEYKKAREDLAKTKQRLIVASNEREDFKKAVDALNKYVKDCEEAVEKLKKTGENNVLRGNFGKKENG